ncbi:MAG: prepilin-type N-terminal cleavage/methylation domain-containing protein [Bacteroidota bacterium]
MSFSKIWQRKVISSVKSTDDGGFTLLELLVAVIISGLVVSGLLYLVVELLRIDNRETALEEVQRDTRRAMNYMADDLREAVYVYSTPTTVTSTAITGVGSALPTGATPILAFWRIQPISQDQMPGVCSTAFTGTAEDTCDALKIRRSAYELVVYSQHQGPTAPWEGPSRISRYSLSQYEDASQLIETPGYVDPGLQLSSFEGWEADTADPVQPGGAAVLVDYIDKIGTSSNAVKCEDWIPDSNPGDYFLSPPGAPEDSSFFACVRDTDSETQQDLQIARSNQDVYIFLRGDASARSASIAPASEISRSPMLQTQVLIRGVVNKNPTD